MVKNWVDRTNIDRMGIDELRDELVLALSKQFALQAALRDLPEMADLPALFFLASSAKWPEDKNKGSELQRNLGSEVIPYKSELEQGAGFYWRIREGLKLLEQKSKTQVPPLVKGTVYQLQTGPAEYKGIDVFYGEATHWFQTAKGDRFIKPELLAKELEQ